MPMRFTKATALILVLLMGGPAFAQRSRRASKEPDTGPVSVTRSATFQVAIAGDVASVFDYFADSHKLALWFPDQAIIEPQLGGKYHFRWNGTEGVWSGLVTDFLRGNTIGFTWQPPGEPVETQVRFKFSPQGGQTAIVLVHSGFTSSEAMDKAVKSWVFYLQNLKSVVEEGKDLRVAARFPAPRAAARRRKK
ncbi:MAG: SRPBCC domain-containing protein [Acidobacteriia bacterium]|nr:SRPBCC domain-containing protein [Terriglobia bacterium]